MRALLNGSQFKKLLEKEFLDIEKRYDLRKIDLQVLLYLGHAGEQNTATEITTRGNFTKGHVSQALAHLKALGLIETVRDAEDGRCIHVLLRDEAADVMCQIKSIDEKITGILFAGLTEEEIKIFRRASRKIAENIHASIQP